MTLRYPRAVSSSTSRSWTSGSSARAARQRRFRGWRGRRGAGRGRRGIPARAPRVRRARSSAACPRSLPTKTESSTTGRRKRAHPTSATRRGESSRISLFVSPASSSGLRTPNSARGLAPGPVIAPIIGIAAVGDHRDSAFGRKRGERRIELMLAVIAAVHRIRVLRPLELAGGMMW